MPKKSEVKDSCACECCCGGKALVAVAAVAGLVLALIACIFAVKAANFAEKTYEITALPAGGEANLEKMNDLYRSEAYVKYATERTNETIAEFNAVYGTTSDESNDTYEDNSFEEDSYTEDEGMTPAAETLTADDIAVLKENGVIYGPENAKITILEFADASCGYCKRQIGQDHTVDSVMDQYPNDVNMMFKNMPIFNETAAQAMACSEDQLSADAYHQYVVAVFQMDDATSVDELANLATNYGADSAAIANCVNNAEKASEVATTMNEGQSFGISGTPSSVIINNESGEYTVVPGAYPVETFVEAIEALLS